MADEERAAEVAVTWQADPQRFAGVVNEFPTVKPVRRAAILVGSSSVVLVLLDVWVDDFTIGRVRFTDTNSPWLWFLLISLNVFITGLYVLLRHSLLVLATPGSRTWRFSEQGLRVESVSPGDDDGRGRSSVVNEYPWAELVRWNCVNEHLMIEIRRPNGKSPHMAGAAPLTAFSKPEWAATKEQLVQHLGSDA